MENYRSGELGRYSQVTPGMIAKDLREIKEGRVFDLAVEINRNMTTGDPCQKDIFPEFNLVTYLAPEKNKGHTDIRGITWATELIIGGIHNATHLDALSHIQYDGKIIGKFKVEEESTGFGMKKCGVETVPPILSRGIMLDIAGHMGVDKLKDSHVITKKEVKETITAADVTLRFGDTLLIRTGKIKDFFNKTYMNKGPGIGLEAASWLYDQGICLMGSDYTSIEGQPLDLENCVHKEMLYEKGIYLLENLYLEELSREKVFQFFFICLPLKIAGSTGSWVRPIAII